MGQVVQFPEKQETIQYIYRCGNCHSHEFKLIEGGEIECSGCESILTDARHFDPNE